MNWRGRSWGTALLIVTLVECVAAREWDFNREIRPILADKCFACHGPDAAARQADLRLDQRDAALGVLAPDRPDDSEVLARLTHADAELRMPPPDAAKQLSPAELETLRAWVADGAPYAVHWSFVPLRRPPVPEVRNAWIRNDIDRFIWRRLAREGLQPAVAAEPETLLRRATLDLTGLPPTPAQQVSFMRDRQWEALIERLMDSPRYGEHMAYRWLDAARYADSDGYESDPLRNMWPWRDWVVDAFNRHLPYDQFIVEQLAGDQLPEPSLRQVLATGFNRNHRLNNEGGIDPAEWIVEYVCDRAETTATVFMGLTWQCARCHDHKFDPITSRDYYQLFSFFHQLPEVGNGNGARNAPPMLEVSAVPKLAELERVQAAMLPLSHELARHGSTSAFAEAFAEFRQQLEADEAARESLPKTLRKPPPSAWKPAEEEAARRFFLRERYPAAAKLSGELTTWEARATQLKATGAKVMVMGDQEEFRTSYILRRGAFDQPTEQVTSATPHFLPPMREGLPKTRLGLARWLVDPEHPLTARVAVNRTWERFFGVGLVKTAEDFGVQGETPSHPELLDYLAHRFMDSGWDLQALQKLILTSATYRQSAVATREQLDRDPENRLLARGPRYRLPAAVIRDQALAASGMLVEQLGGPPVKPYQPLGLWQEIIKGRVKYRRDSGEKLYRRSLYTLWRRAVKPPLMSLLDANGRDTCAVRHQRTNTPLQALLLLNDETFVELSRGLAIRLLRPGGLTDEVLVERGMGYVLGRSATSQERGILLQELRRQRAYFREHPHEAAALLTVGEAEVPSDLDPAELAATTLVARVLLNLDETLTRE